MSENKIDSSESRKRFMQQAKEKSYYLINVKPNLYLSFLKVLIADNIELQSPVIIDQTLFKNSIAVCKETLTQLLKIYNSRYFLRDLKKELLVNGPDYLDTICKKVELTQYLEEQVQKEEKEFKIGDIVLLTLDNKYYVIENLNLKKNEAIINSKTSTSDLSSPKNINSTILKVKLNLIKHAN